MINLRELIKLVDGELTDTDSDSIEIKKISTDTRTLEKGDLYIPLKGENFDGENFIESAIEKGAVAYLYTNKKSNSGSVGIRVSDTKEAYLKLANFYRKKVNPKVILITGSSGKTTTKELVYSVVSQKFKTIKTASNHNNEIGLCQTIFSMDSSTEVLIIEAGMRGLGEIDLISKYSEPDISIITNVGTAHIGRLGSRENIARAKCEVSNHQSKDGVLIAHDDNLIKSTTNYNGEKIYYSLKDVEILKKEIGYSLFKYEGEEYELNVEGEHNIENSLSAINTGKYLGLGYSEIKKGLSEYRPIEKRWQVEAVCGYKIINDSYNANPDSMRATLDTVLDLYRDVVVVLGDMFELGENEKEYHRQIGEYLNQKNRADIKVLTVGSLSKLITDEINVCDSMNFKDNEDLARYITENIDNKKTIFLKGSRSMKLEEILTYIKTIKGDN